MTMTEYIRQQWRRFRAWQLDPTHDMEPSDRSMTHHCANCGTEFTGRYCSECGQRAGTGRITWGSIHQGMMELWGLNTRSLPYTLWQLVWRPGYLIGDYLRGRRQLSFPPIKMLVLVSLFAFVFAKFFDDQLNDVNVSHLVMAADIVNLTDPAISYDQINSLAVIFNIEPVADILTFSIDRERLVVETISDHQRDQFLREMVRAIVV